MECQELIAMRKSLWHTLTASIELTAMDLMLVISPADHSILMAIRLDIKRSVIKAK